MLEGLKVRGLITAMPIVQSWITNLLAQEHPNTTKIPKKYRPRLEKYFPKNLLNKVRIVIADDTVPCAPFINSTLVAAITYMDTIFICKAHQSTSLYFHELVHVVQWKKLGMKKLILAYGMGLIEYGYENNPFETMAYELEQEFDDKQEIPKLVSRIQRETVDIWTEVPEIIKRKGG